MLMKKRTKFSSTQTNSAKKSKKLFLEVFLDIAFENINIFEIEKEPIKAGFLGELFLEDDLFDKHVRIFSL